MVIMVNQVESNAEQSAVAGDNPDPPPGLVQAKAEDQNPKDVGPAKEPQGEPAKSDSCVVQKQPEEGVWMDVALTTENEVEVGCAYANNALLAIAEKEGFVNLQMQDFEKGLTVAPASTYKFRVAAVNSLGVGPWSEVTAYRTLVPGLPGAPNTVKVTKADNGAVVSWEPPSNSASDGNITEFVVFLAVSNGKDKTPSFQRVYQGPQSTCLVTTNQLQQAMIDPTGARPAIIFRIAARNEKGMFGPATQVRWLQTG